MPCELYVSKAIIRKAHVVKGLLAMSPCFGSKSNTFVSLFIQTLPESLGQSRSRADFYQDKMVILNIRSLKLGGKPIIELLIHCCGKRKGPG